MKPARTKADLSPVLLYPNSAGPEVAYFMFKGISKGKWENITMTVSGDYGGEFVKTYGHYHEAQVDETYLLIHGKGLFLLQEKYFENNSWVQNRVKNFYIVEPKVGDEIVVKPQLAHSWSNLCDTPLITFDTWQSGHTGLDYEPITKQKGLAYYLVKDNGQAKLVPNLNYVDTPDPKWLTVAEYNKLIK